MNSKQNELTTPVQHMQYVDRIKVVTPEVMLFSQTASRLMERAGQVDFPGGVIVIGGSGTGKSHLAEQFYQGHQPYDDGTKHIVPMMLISMSQRPTTLSIAISIFENIKYPYDRDMSASNLLSSLCNALYAVGVKLIVFDEGQHTFEGNRKDSGREVCDYIKLIHTATRIPFIILGTQQLNKVDVFGEQLAQRLPGRIDLHSMRENPIEYAGMYKGLLNKLPIKTVQDIDSQKVSGEVLISCQGSKRLLKMLFSEAVYQAISNNNKLLKRIHLETAHTNLFGARDNPFK